MKKLVFLSIIFTSILSFGQDTLNIDSTKLRLTLLNSVDVTGVRADEKTPVSASTITREDIKANYQGEEIPVLISSSPSITKQSDGGHNQGYTYFSLRGIDQTRINMTLNGVPLNEPEDQGVYFSNYPGFANNIQSMQIQRGVGTSSNGVSSYGGSINFESPSGKTRETSIEAGYGSFNTRRFNATHSTGLNDKLALYTSFSTLASDGYRYHSGNSGYSFFTSGGYYGNKNILKFTAFSGRSFNQMAWYGVDEETIKLDPRTNYNTKDEKDDFAQNFVQLQYTRKLTSKSLLNVTTYYNRLDGNWNLDLTPYGATGIFNYQLGSNFLGVMANHKYLGKKLSTNIGVHANKYERMHAGAILPDASVALYRNQGLKDEMSAFAKAFYDIGRFTLFGDVQARYVTFKYNGSVAFPTQEWNFINPKGGLTYRVTNNLRTYFSVGQTKREPTRNAMFGGEDDLIAYTLITPEQVTDYELGMALKRKKLTIESNLYYMDFQNEIVFLGELGPNGLPLAGNVNQSFRSGIEASVNYNITSKLGVYGNTNLSYNRINTTSGDINQPYTPSNITNMGINYTIGGLTVGITGRYRGRTFIDINNIHSMSPYTTLGANISYKYRRYTLIGSVNNILINTNRYYGGGYVFDGIAYYYVNPPVNGSVTLRMNF